MPERVFLALRVVAGREPKLDSLLQSPPHLAFICLGDPREDARSEAAPHRTPDLHEPLVRAEPVQAGREGIRQ